jgi:hypothetical protein
VIPLCKDCHAKVHRQGENRWNDPLWWLHLQKAGIERAKARGAYKGRVKGTFKAKDGPARAHGLRAAGMSVPKIARELGIATRTAFRYLSMEIPASEILDASGERGGDGAESPPQTTDVPTASPTASPTAAPSAVSTAGPRRSRPTWRLPMPTSASLRPGIAPSRWKSRPVSPRRPRGILGPTPAAFVR